MYYLKWNLEVPRYCVLDEDARFTWTVFQEKATRFSSEDAKSHWENLSNSDITIIKG